MSEDIVAQLMAFPVYVVALDDIKEAADLIDDQQDRIEAQAAEITRLCAELATARQEGMEDAAKRLEELHKNHGYNPQTGEVWRLGKLVTCPLTIDHAIGYYRAIAEGVAHIRAAMEGKKDE